jgi:hypothetical protein
MNERIKQIADECGLYIAYDNRVVTDKELSFFAEMVVRDIHAYVDSMDTAQIISNGILRRYGVTV